MRQTMQAQNELGVWNLLMGRIHHSFEDLQNKHYKKKKSRRSGLRWTTAIIKKLFDVSWDMWEHRNGILHAIPDRHFRADDLEEANQDIDTEWNRGKAGLLIQDHFLFRSRNAVNDRNLEKKWEWLTSVREARAAAAHAATVTDSFNTERRGIQDWLQGSNKRARVGT